jgi:hypothetical protein
LTTEEVKLLTNHVFAKSREARETVRNSNHFRDGEHISDASRFVAFVEHIHHMLELNKANLRFSISITIYCLLELIQKDYENEGKYIEAGQVQQNLKELIDQEITDRHSVFHSNQMRNSESLKNAHKEQQNAFSKGKSEKTFKIIISVKVSSSKCIFQIMKKEWDKFEKEFETKSREALNSLRTNQEAKLQRYREKLNIKAKSKPPLWSKELKHWRKQEMILASEENYSEAAKVKEIADALELEEQKNIKNQSNSSCFRKESNMQKLHEAELQALTKRINAQRESNRKQREDDCKRLVQRNKNIQVSYKSKQIAEGQKFFNSIQNDVQHELAECRQNGLPIAQQK